MVDQAARGRIEGRHSPALLESSVRRFFVDHRESFGLDPHSLRVDYVLNWGGFVNYSFRIQDARTRYHLKLSSSAAGRESLSRWRRLAPHLEPYHAPPILEWIDLDVAAGLLFPHVAGRPPRLRGAVLGELVPVLARLHGDRELYALVCGNRTVTAKDAYFAGFHERFTEDLAHIRAARPEFVSPGVLAWLRDEVRSLARLVRAAAVFQEPLESPVHGDVWLHNVSWVDRRDWHLLDWDGVGVGDPAIDLATLIGPDARDLRPLKMYDRVARDLTGSQRERLRLLGRATLLDWVIDPVADWIEADRLPARRREVRAEKERVHQAALARYRKLSPA